MTNNAKAIVRTALAVIDAFECGYFEPITSAEAQKKGYDTDASTAGFYGTDEFDAITCADGDIQFFIFDETNPNGCIVAQVSPFTGSVLVLG